MKPQRRRIIILCCIIFVGLLWIAHSLVYKISCRETLTTIVDIMRDGMPPGAAR